MRQLKAGPYVVGEDRLRHEALVLPGVDGFVDAGRAHVLEARVQVLIQVVDGLGEEGCDCARGRGPRPTPAARPAECSQLTSGPGASRTPAYRAPVHGGLPTAPRACRGAVEVSDVPVAPPVSVRCCGHGFSGTRPSPSSSPDPREEAVWPRWLSRRPPPPGATGRICCFLVFSSDGPPPQAQGDPREADGRSGERHPRPPDPAGRCI